MATVALEGMRFYGYHGVYEEEAKTGTYFELDVYVDFDWKPVAKDPVINYEEIFSISQEVMRQRKSLLEELVQDIVNKLRSNNTGLGDIKVRLKKCNPPLGGEVKQAMIEWVDEA